MPVTITRHLYFIRHGEYNETDDDRTQMLTNTGQQQAEGTGHFLSTQLHGPIHIYSSNLMRAKQTTEILMRNLTECDVTVRYDSMFS